MAKVIKTYKEIVLAMRFIGKNTQTKTVLTAHSVQNGASGFRTTGLPRSKSSEHRTGLITDTLAI